MCGSPCLPPILGTGLSSENHTSFSLTGILRHHHLDTRRSFSDSVLVDAVLLDEENHRPVELFMLKGPGGNGKSVSLKRIAWEASVTYDQLVLYPTGPAGLRLEPPAEIHHHHLTGTRIFLFVDHVALVRNELRDLLQAARSRSIPLSIVGAERDNEWNIYCEQLEPFVRQEFPVRYLNEQEIRELVNLLERHDALGLLKNLTLEDRINKFIETAERQLLVALHEATRGIPFEYIIVDEFELAKPRIHPAEFYGGNEDDSADGLVQGAIRVWKP